MSTSASVSTGDVSRAARGAERPRDWPPFHALFALVAAACTADVAFAPFRGDSVALQNVVLFSGLALGVIVAAIVSQRGSLSLLSRTRPGVRWVCWIGVGLVLVSVCGDGWVHVFHPAARDASLNVVAERVRGAQHGSPSALMLGLWAVVAGPVAEELVFRGVVFNVVAQTRKWFAPRYASAFVLLAAIFSSLLFALYHVAAGDAAITIPDRFAMGMVLCAVYWQTGSLLPGVVVHAAWNFGWLQVAALGLHPAVLGAWPAIDVPVVLVALAALAAVSGAAARRRDGRARTSCSMGPSGSS